MTDLVRSRHHVGAAGRRSDQSRRSRLRGAAFTGAAYAVLTATVAAGWWDRFDSTVRYWFRPHDEWGPRQLAADRVVEGLQPAVMLLLVMVLAVLVVITRRSIRPVRRPAVLVIAVAAVTVITKVLVARPDTHDQVIGAGGSYPSGHLVCVTMGTVLAIRLAWPPHRGQRLRQTVRWAIPLAAAGLMSVALLAEAAHWATDLIGSALLLSTVLLLDNAFPAASDDLTVRAESGES